MVKLFGPRAASLPCTSTKPITGHCLGATPALEVVLCIEALQQQRIPPTANCTQPDPLCPLNTRPGAVPDGPIAHVLSNSLGFWGYQAALVFSAAV
jgi:3-oxoacyl-(acyl-carrier-protein) synthase